MAEAYIELLMAFGFKEMQIWIATISALLFSMNLLGGILSALMFVNSNLAIQRPLSQRISFRLHILTEVILLIFIFFYHVFMIESITLSHIIYWISAVMMMPLLAIIGSQTILVSMSGRVKAKEEDYKRQQRAIRAARAKEMGDDDTPKGPSKLADKVKQKRIDEMRRKARQKK